MERAIRYRGAPLYRGDLARLFEEAEILKDGIDVGEPHRQ
jgi:hypothetical protein